MKVSLVAAAMAAALVTAPAWAQQSSGSNGLSSADQQFLKQAGQANAAEVQEGQLASQKAAHETVKELGRWMASSHGFANRELATIVEKNHGQSPAMSPNAEQQSMLQKLQGLSGAQFDREYLQHQVQDHRKVIGMFENEAQNGQDHLVKTFAQNYLPSLRAHLTEAEDLQNDIFHVGSQTAGAAANATVQAEAGSTSPTSGAR